MLAVVVLNAADRVRAGVPRRAGDRRAGRAGRRAGARAPRRRLGRDPGRGRRARRRGRGRRRATASPPTCGCSTRDALRAQEAALTGESEPVDKGVGAGRGRTRRWPSAAACSTPARWSRRAAGRGVAVATGTDTELGRISALLERGRRRCETPLTRELDRFGRVITAAIGGRRRRARPSRPSSAASRSPTRRWPAISLAVAAVPEGLPGGRDDRARRRRAADGPPAGDHPPPAGGRDARAARPSWRRTRPAR